MKRCGLLSIVLVLLICLCSCSTFSSRVRASVSGYPVWYYDASALAGSDQKSFVAIGKSETERQAELLAYSDLRDHLSAYLGSEVSRQSYRELVTLGSIEKYSLKVKENYSALKNGEYVVMLFAVADNENIQPLRTDQAIAIENKAQSIIDLVLQGDEYLKNDQDINGVSCYLKSMALSYGFNEIDSQYSFDAIQKEVFNILNTTSIVIESSDSSKVSADLKVRRKESIIASEVENCKVKASYYSIDAEGKSYSDYFVYTTDRNGRVNFRIFNNALVKKGSVVFSIDLNEELEALRNVYPASVALIESMLSSKSVKFDYDRQYSLGKIGICFMEYNSDGALKDSDTYSNFLCSLFENEEINCKSIKTVSDDSDEQIIAKAKSEDSSFGCYAILRAGTTDVQVSATSIVSVTLEGKAVFNDRNGKVLYKSEMIYSNGFGHSVEEAEKAAFENMCRIMFTSLKASYV